MKLRKSVGVALVLASAVAPIALAPAAQAAGSGYGYYYEGGARYTYYGDDRQSGSTIIANTNVPGFSDCFNVRSVQTTIRLPNGATVTGGSLIGGCSFSVQMNLQGYPIWTVSTTHQVTLWNGVKYSFKD